MISVDANKRTCLFLRAPLDYKAPAPEEGTKRDNREDAGYAKDAQSRTKDEEARN
jgi:hypothetical protein